MNKLLYWILKIISVILLTPAFIVAIPGFIFYVLSEECEEWDVNKSMKNYYGSTGINSLRDKKNGYGKTWGDE